MTTSIPPSSPQGFATSPTAQGAVKKPRTLVALIVFAAVHILLNGIIFLFGVESGNGAALGGGFVCIGFYIAILVGLIQMQEWARIMILWLGYCGIVFSMGLYAPIEIPTLILAHWPSVRRATQGASIPKTYTYREAVEETQH